MIIGNKITALDLQQFTDILAPRPRDANKGNFGHVLVIGGDKGYIGAVKMAAEGALRVGAGLVSVATRADHAAWLALTRPEIMAHGVEQSSDLDPLLNKANAIVIGPGLGRSAWAQKLLFLVLKSERPVVVVDADALNLLAIKPLQKSNWILTPHPGEAARLLKKTVADIQADRVAAVLTLQKEFGGVCVLKGAGTLVSGGEDSLFICKAGNPGMASGGMGDILSGVIGGLLAQGLPALRAATLGVLVHAMAADAAATAGERGMIATDLLPYLRQLVN